MLGRPARAICNFAELAIAGERSRPPLWGRAGVGGRAGATSERRNVHLYHINERGAASAKALEIGMLCDPPP